MTTKSPDKQAAGPEKARPPQESMQAAYQVHTLAQMLYGQLPVANPWAAYTLGHYGADPMRVAEGSPYWAGAHALPPWSWPHAAPFMGSMPVPGPFGPFPR
jgi:hypothetical protein